ncbi:MAG: TRAP transporter small permease subunit [Pseudomonadota bacterium]
MLDRILAIIDGFNEKLGRTIAWLLIAMVITQFVVVLLRYAFGYGSILMQESVVYMHGMLFMLGAGYTLKHDEHVRIDLFYRTASKRNKAKVDFLGALVLLIPVTVMIFISSYSYVQHSWAVFEGSRETSGIQGVYLLKTMILIFCVLLALQGIAQAIRAGRHLFSSSSSSPSA